MITLPRKIKEIALLTLAALMLGLSLPQPTQAAVGIPKLINLQGRLTDENDNLLDGTYYLCFSVYDALTDGNKLWPAGTPATTTVTAANGVFSTQVGSADALTLDFNADTYYLNVYVNDADSCTVGGENLTPRQRITAAGYAFNADTVDGLHSTSLLRTDAANVFNETGADLDFRFEGDNNDSLLFLDASTDRIGIGTSGPATRLHIVGTTEQLRLAYDTDSFASFTVALDSDLTIKPAETGQIILQPTTDSTTFLQILDQDGGTPILNIDATNEFVGIGTTAPAGPLEIDTGTTSGIAVTIDQDDVDQTALDFDINNTAGDIFNLDWGGATTQTAALTGLDLDFSNLTTVAGSTTYGIRINELGTQTSSTEYAIYLQGDEWDRGIYSESDLQIIDSKEIYLGTGNDLELFHDGTDSYLQNNTGSIVIENDASDGDISLKVNDGGVDTTVMTLDGATGNVGIGTTGPGFKLHILGSDAASSSIAQQRISNDTYGAYQYYVKSRSTATGPALANDLMGGFIWSAYNSASARKDLAGIWGKVESPTAGSESGTILFYTATDGSIDEVLDERMRITSSGNVGIGTTGPTGKLSVAGGVGIGTTASNSPYHSIATPPDGGLIVAGNVGIGTTNPAYKLQVTGTLGVGSTAYFASNVGIGTTVPTSKLSIAGGIGIGSTSLTSVYHSTASAPDGGMIVEGKVGIGTTLPSGKLSIAGGVGIGTTATNSVYHSVATPPDGGLIIEGKVGIGTTNPGSYKLNVNGADSYFSNDLVVAGGKVTGSNGEYVQIGETENQITLYLSTGVYAQLNATTFDLSGVSLPGDDIEDNTVDDTEIQDNSLDFADFQDTLDLDATLVWNVGSYDINIDTGTFFLDGDADRVGIGITAPNHKLDVNGNIGIAGSGYLNFGNIDGDSGYGMRDNAGTIELKSSGGSWLAPLAGSGTANYIPKFTSPSTLGVSLIYDSGTGIGIGTAVPNASALLDLTSTTKGFLMPRLTTTQRDAVGSPATGLLIFNTTTGRFEYYTGSAWTPFEYTADIYFQDAGEQATALSNKTDAEAASILYSFDTNFAASVVNSANITATKVNTIMDSSNITSTKIKDILQTGALTDTDKIAALLDGSSLASIDGTVVVDDTTYTIAQLASAYNSTQLAATKATTISVNAVIDTIASIFDHTNLTAANAVEIINEAAFSATFTSYIADSAYISSARIKAFLDTGSLTTTDDIAALLDGSSLTAADAATHVNGGAYSTATMASSFAASYLAAAKGASIFDSTNLTAANAATLFNHANFTAAKAASICDSTNLTSSRAGAIFESTNLTAANAVLILQHANLTADRTQTVMYAMSTFSRQIDILTSGASDLTVSADTTISGTNRYGSLTIDGTKTLTVGTQPGVIIADTLTNNGTVTKAANGGTAGAAGGAGCGAGGVGGGGLYVIVDTFDNNSTVQANGAQGGNGGTTGGGSHGGTGGAGAFTRISTNTPLYGGNGGYYSGGPASNRAINAGGGGSYMYGTTANGGSATASTYTTYATANLLYTAVRQATLDWWIANVASKSPSAPASFPTAYGGGGGGGGASNGNSCCGGGAAGGGEIIVVANTFDNTSSTVQVNGGNGGDAGSEGSHDNGGGGGGGGIIYGLYRTTLTAAGTLQGTGGIHGTHDDTGGGDGSATTVATTSNVSGADIAENYSTHDKSIQAGDLVSAKGPDGEVGIFYVGDDNPELKDKNLYPTNEQVTNPTPSGSGSSGVIGVSENFGVSGQNLINAPPFSVAKPTKAYDPKTLGIVATNPAMILGPPDEDSVPIALVGRVPTKVTSINGGLSPGDAITTSDLPGFGMKSTRAGPTVGKALTGTSHWSEEKCPVVGSLEEINWPMDDGRNPANPCFRVPVSSFDEETRKQLLENYHLGSIPRLTRFQSDNSKTSHSESTSSADGLVSESNQILNLVQDDDEEASGSAVLSEATPSANLTDGEGDSIPLDELGVQSDNDNSHSELVSESALETLKQVQGDTDKERYLYVGKVIVFVNLSWFDPDAFLTNSGDIKIIASDGDSLDLLLGGDSSQQQVLSIKDKKLKNYLVTNGGLAVDKVGAFKEIIAAAIRTGILQAQKIIAGEASFESLTAQEIASPLVETDTLKMMNHELGIMNDGGKQVVAIDSQGNVNFAGEVKGAKIISPIVEAQEASISGQLTAQSAEISDTLKVKNLEVENIIVKSKDGVSNPPSPTPFGQLLGETPPTPQTPSDSIPLDKLGVQNDESSNSNSHSELGSESALGTLKPASPLAPQGGQVQDDDLEATSAAEFRPFQELAEATISGDLTVQGKAHFLDHTVLNDTTVTGDLTQGGTLSITEGSKIDNLAGDLSLQKDSLVISKEGTVSAKKKVVIENEDLTKDELEQIGNVEGTKGHSELVSESGTLNPASPAGGLAQGDETEGDQGIHQILKKIKTVFEVRNTLADRLLAYLDNTGRFFARLLTGYQVQTDVISPLSGDVLAIKLPNQNSQFAIHNSEGKAVAAIDATGATTVDKLNIKSAANIGSGAIAAGRLQTLVNTTAVTADSKVFITPTSPTDNQTPYVFAKIPGSAFVVKIDQLISRDLSFDWWIVN